MLFYLSMVNGLTINDEKILLSLHFIVSSPFHSFGLFISALRPTCLNCCNFVVVVV